MQGAYLGDNENIVSPTFAKLYCDGLRAYLRNVQYPRPDLQDTTIEAAGTSIIVQ